MHTRRLGRCSCALALTVWLFGCTSNAPAVEPARESVRPASGDAALIEQLVLLNPDRYFISDAVSPGLVTAADIYESDLESNPVSGARPGLLDERFMHGEVYKAQPDVMAIVFTKAPALVAFSVSAVPLPVNNRQTPVVDTRRVPGGEHGVINSPALGKALADALGKNNAVLLFGEGALVVGPSAGNVVNAALDLRTGADDRAFQISVGGTLSHLAYTREQAIPEAGGRDDTGPTRPCRSERGVQT